MNKPTPPAHSAERGRNKSSVLGAGAKKQRTMENIEDNLLLTELDAKIEQAIFSGLLKIKRDIGDKDLGEYLDEQKEVARKKLFPNSLA